MSLAASNLGMEHLVLAMEKKRELALFREVFLRKWYIVLRLHHIRRPHGRNDSIHESGSGTALDTPDRRWSKTAMLFKQAPYDNPHTSSMVSYWRVWRKSSTMTTMITTKKTPMYVQAASYDNQYDFDGELSASQSRSTRWPPWSDDHYDAHQGDRWPFQVGWPSDLREARRALTERWST